MRVAEHLIRTILRVRGYKSHYIDTSAGPLHYMTKECSGKLPPVVLLHGLGSAGVHYGALLRHLKKHVRKIIIIDFPGHGFSRHSNIELDASLFRDGVEEALDMIIKERVILYGNSLGGLAALRYSLVKPEFIHSLVVCSPGGAPMTTLEREALFSLFRPSSHEACLEFVDRLLSKKYGTRHLFGLGVRFALKDATIQRLLHSIDDEVMFTPEEVSGLQVPTLCVWGKSDGILPWSGERFFKQHLPESFAEFSSPDDFGHSPHLEFPRRVAEQIIRFVQLEV